MNMKTIALQKWTKLGLIFVPDGSLPWMKTHAANPVAEHLYDDIFRIYFSSRDERNRSSIGFIEVDINLPVTILKLSEQPVLSPGEAGTFDDSGVSISCIKTVKNKKLLFYLGWNLGVTVPWRNSIGLAIYNEAVKQFEKFGRAPILDRNNIDPFSISYPFVLQDGDILQMWYGSNLGWGKDIKDMKHVIKYAVSKDGISWERNGKICIGLRDEEEYAISKPFVLNENSVYKMWYSYRGSAYRIGYAESLDGINWERKDNLVDLSVSNTGWDSDMIEYSFIFDHKGKRYMLYNGNSYGRTGIGLSVLHS